MKFFRLCVSLMVVMLTFVWLSPPAQAFCGFYVAKADTSLYNKASQVAIARDGNRTVVTMANDFQGDMKDFAIVVPVPTVLQEDQVNVGDPKILERLDAFSAPRLVEYFDDDPCQVIPEFEDRLQVPVAPSAAAGSNRSDQSLGVTVEAQFTVGEYDIVVLGAKESSGLETWLRRNGYKVPQGAQALLRPYIRQNMKFFVAKVNLNEFAKSDFKFLRPIQMAYESPKFMLPIRLGMINSEGEQDLVVYVLSPKGQAEITNYRTVNVPTDSEIPVYVKEKFNDFYPAMFKNAYEREGKKVAFREYAWDMANCDPCSSEPLTREELRQAGVFWLTERSRSSLVVPPQSTGVFITRLHVRYSRDQFPEDLKFQETSNRQLFQGRYVLRHPFEGDADCAPGRQYKRALNTRFEKEAQTLAQLTGWNITDIRSQMNFERPQPTRWWKNLWNFVFDRAVA
ncbi:MAG: DUF2330 domain-containing protein [Thermosynechococcaceae cyanobacterium]